MAMQGDSRLLKHFEQMGRKVSPQLRWSARNGEEHRRWRRKFRRKLAELVGRMPRHVPLRVHTAESIEFEGFTRRKIYVRTERNYWMPAYYFVPRGLTAPAPAVVCLHGHSGIFPYIREGSAQERQQCQKLALDFAPFLAENGYVTLAPIQRGWNETAEGVDRHETGCQRMVLNAFLMGMTPVGLRCWDASRAVDFLASRHEVDGSRIGVAGLSGGGMVGLFWAAMERRVKLAMIAGYYCTFRESIYSIHHCLCNCVPGIMQWGEMREVAALIAPRPLLVISGTRDPIFPIRATRRAFGELAQVYKLLEGAGNLEKDFFEGPHAWSNRKTLAFLAKHFAGRAGQGSTS